MFVKTNTRPQIKLQATGDEQTVEESTFNSSSWSQTCECNHGALQHIFRFVPNECYMRPIPSDIPDWCRTALSDHPVRANAMHSHISIVQFGWLILSAINAGCDQKIKADQRWAIITNRLFFSSHCRMLSMYEYCTKFAAQAEKNRNLVVLFENEQNIQSSYNNINTLFTLDLTQIINCDYFMMALMKLPNLVNRNQKSFPI